MRLLRLGLSLRGRRRPDCGRTAWCNSVMSTLHNAGGAAISGQSGGTVTLRRDDAVGGGHSVPRADPAGGRPMEDGHAALPRRAGRVADLVDGRAAAQGVDARPCLAAVCLGDGRTPGRGQRKINFPWRTPRVPPRGSTPGWSRERSVPPRWRGSPGVILRRAWPGHSAKTRLPCAGASGGSRCGSTVGLMT